MPSHWNIFWSTEPLAQGVLIALVVLFGLWLALVFSSAIGLLREWRAFRKLEDVSPLVDRGRGAEGTRSDLSYRDRLFREYADAKGVSRRSVAARHVYAIFDAGWSDARLDVSELNRFTLQQLFRWAPLTRSLLSLFIVVGLFGTLAGLSQALVPLSALDLSGGTPPDMAVQLRGLLEKLKSAFAPSVLGVFLTVVGVLIYSVFVRGISGPLQSLVDRLTLSVWVPRLYPTTSQRVLQTLEEADRQAHENLHAAQRVAEFADRIEGDLRDLGPNLQNANETVVAFADTVRLAKVAAEAMKGAVTNIHEFKDDLREAYERIGEQSERTNRLFTQLEHQNARLSEGVRVLRVFEDTFVDQQRLQADEQREAHEALRRLVVSASEAVERLGEQGNGAFDAVAKRGEELLRSISDQSHEVIGSVAKQGEEVLGAVRKQSSSVLGSVARQGEEVLGSVAKQGHEVIGSVAKQSQEVLGALSERNEEVLKALGEPLTERLGQLDVSLRDRLGSIGTSLRSIEDPMKASSERIEGIADSFDKSVTRLLGELKREFDRQNEQNQTAQKGLSELNDHFTRLLDAVERSTERQERMTSAVESLHGLVLKRPQRRRFSQWVRGLFGQRSDYYADRDNHRRIRRGSDPGGSENGSPRPRGGAKPDSGDVEKDGGGRG